MGGGALAGFRAPIYNRPQMDNIVRTAEILAA